MQINLVPDPSLLAIVVIFFLNYLVVRRFFLKPINDIIGEAAENAMNLVVNDDLFVTELQRVC